MRRNFRHFDEEIIILNIMNVSTMSEKLTCYASPVFSSASICGCPWSFRSCLVSKDNKYSSEINNYLSCT